MDRDTPILHSRETVRTAILAALFAALTAVGALIRIPVPPVPFTLQTLSVFLAAGLLSPGGAFTSQVLYLAAGLLGLPVFAGGGGIGYIFDPTFGYLLSFPIAAFVMGVLSKRLQSPDQKAQRNDKRKFVHYIVIYGSGSIVIYTIGVTFFFIYSKALLGDIFNVLWVGFVIFLPSDIIKIAVGAWLTIRIRRATPNILLTH